MVLAFLVCVAVLGLVFAKRASKSLSDYFVGGRSVPWWLAGTSMLATSFASDTPLHVTRAIREGGLARAWFYWEGIIGGVVVALIFSKLWRRAAVLTDNEFIELRYTGKPAAVLRGGMAIFKALFLEIITMAWITLGMVKIVTTILGLPEVTEVAGVALPTNAFVVLALILTALAFSVTSGFWGVVATDALEFAVAMTGAIVLCVIAMMKVGGVEGLRAGLEAHAPMGAKAMDFTPGFNLEGLGMLTFGVYLGVQWWARHEVDGSGQRAQRFSSCKNEKEAIAAGLWNLTVQWLIRSWPWYIAALCSLVLYPHLADAETAYPLMVRDLMPVGLKGLMVASFFAAFMGTMESHYNMTASYLLNDVYKRFVSKKRDDKHYVRVSRILTALVATVAGIGSLLLPSVLGAFRFKVELVCGIGLILVLRWFWWRISALSELVALGTSVVTALLLNAYLQAPDLASAGDYSALRLAITVLVSAATSISATLLTKPEPTEHLIAFYKRVKPPRTFWGPIADAAGDVGSSGVGWNTVGQSLLAILFVFGGMFGLGKFLLGDTATGLALFGVSAVTGYLTIRWIFTEPVPDAPAATVVK